MASTDPIAGERKFWMFTCQQCLSEHNSRTPDKFSAVSRTKERGWKLIDRAWFCATCVPVRTDQFGVGDGDEALVVRDD